MKKLLTALLFVPMLAQAEAIATMPNEGGGKIVLTDEVCKHEGCFYIEDETVVVIWNTSSGTRQMRYPAENFTLTKKKGARYGI
jgi:Rieske Fe-S protein